jgi:Lipid A 3-O-deacylase (PagL)
MSWTKAICLSICLLITSIAYAQDLQTVLDIESGVSNSSQSKMLTLGVQEDMWGALKDKFMAGGWIDNGIGKSSSALVSGQMGFEVDRSGLVGGIFSGPSVVFTPDVLLGGWLQFVSDVHLGIEDTKSNYFGVMYRHISSGGLETPNVGRDYVGVEIKF